MSEPVIVHEGRYRLYENPDGGLVLIYQRDDKDEPDRMSFPGKAVALMKAASEGNLSPAQLLREVMKMRSPL